MSETPRLKLPEIASGQAQKHVTHNDALARLDVLVQVAALTRDQTSPPASPAEGDIHIVAASATGDWAGHGGKLANWRDGSWSFYDAMPGCIAYLIGESASVLFDGSDWLDFTDAVPLQEIASLGINTTADATNKLAVRSSAALFSGIETASGGDGDIRVIVSKEASGDTASHLFQTGYSGRAEFGLTGDDDFHVKVSADGSAWSDALVIDKTTAQVDIPGELGVGDGVGAGVAHIAQGTFTPVFQFVTVSSYTVQSGTYLRIGDFVYIDVEMEWSGLDTADTSDIHVSLPMAGEPLGPAPATFSSDASTGMSFAATDTLYFNLNGAGSSIRFKQTSGAGYSYNSGKILASGKVEFAAWYKAA